MSPLTFQKKRTKGQFPPPSDFVGLGKKRVDWGGTGGTSTGLGLGEGFVVRRSRFWTQIHSSYTDIEGKKSDDIIS